MRKVLLFLVVALASVSCSKLVMDPLRIKIDGTCWLYATETQTARVCFPDDHHVTILQRDNESGYLQSQNGTYELDGHRVLCNGEDWSSTIKFVRTFSHLKNNSTNKNLTPVAVQAHDNLSGSIWGTIVGGDLRFAFFKKDGDCVEGTYRNVAHKEGFPYGWEWQQAPYTLDGNRLEAGPKSAVLYEDFLLVDTLAVFCNSPVPEASEATSELEGTVWVYDTNAAAGVIIFTSGSTFTRMLGVSQLIFATLTGTYSLQGTTLRMEAGDIKETCQLQGGRFTFSEKTYAKLTLP